MSWCNPGIIQYNPLTNEYYYAGLVVSDIATLIPVILKDGGNVEVEIMGEPKEGKEVSSKFLMDTVMADIDYLTENMGRAFIIEGYEPDYALIDEIKGDLIEASVSKFGDTMRIIKSKDVA